MIEPRVTGRGGARTWHLVAAAIVLGLIAIGCSEPEDSKAVQQGGLGHHLVPAGSMTINLANETSLAVTLVVNGDVAGAVTVGQSASFSASRLPDLPWAIEARTMSGRVLTSMTVKAGDVWTTDAPGGPVSKGPWTSVMLSCGRLDIWSWSGAPPPAPSEPGPRSPGDCAP
jgi:hypothetical protein